MKHIDSMIALEHYKKFELAMYSIQLKIGLVTIGGSSPLTFPRSMRASMCACVSVESGRGIYFAI